MSIFEHARYLIFSKRQHPYSHAASEFFYSNEKAPGVNNMEQALNYVFSVLYPNYIGTFATVGALPAIGSSKDYAIVTDDGDGNAAAYIWQVLDDGGAWRKKYDVDFSIEGVLAETINKTQYMYVHKYGMTDIDAAGNPVVGATAGQVIFGGDAANQHLTLFANSGDTGGGNTGFLQFGDSVRPLTHNLFSLGTTIAKFTNLFTMAANVDTMNLATGSITDTSGAITFDNENLSTTGTLTSGTHTVSADLVLATGSITSASGAISFGNENLTTTGNINGANGVFSGTLSVQTDISISTGLITSVSGAISFGNENLSTTGTLGAGAITCTSVAVDNILLDGNTVSITNANGSLNLLANGTGVVDVQSAMTTLGQTVIGTVSITGQLNADNLRLDGNVFSSTNTNGNILIDPNGTGEIEIGSLAFPSGNTDFGKSGNLFKDLWINGAIKDGTNTFGIGDLLTLRNLLFRDTGLTTPVVNGDVLTWSTADNRYLPAAPTSGVTDHTALTSLTTGDAGHTQFVMLTGRAGGQTVQGGTLASQDLVLESTAHATKGEVYTKDHFYSFTNATFSGSWSGADIGGPVNYFRDLYTKGELRGARLENFTSGTLPASSAQNVGRIVWATDNDRPYVDNGSAFVAVGYNKFLSDVAFDGVVTTKDIDVSSTIEDARRAIIQLLDNANDFERIFCVIKATSATNVRIETNLPLPAGNYRLIVID